MADEKGNQTEVGALAISYSSVFNLSVSANEFLLSFATPRLLPDSKSGLPTEAVLVWTHTVIMSPQAAKQLAQLMSRNVDAYEDEVGEIHSLPLPDLAAAPKSVTASKPKARRKRKK